MCIIFVMSSEILFFTFSVRESVQRVSIGENSKYIYGSLKVMPYKSLCGYGTNIRHNIEPPNRSRRHPWIK